jgi:AcrR family transcriptional regulator
MPLGRFKKIEPEKRQRLLQSAAQEFAAAGFEKASLSRIAEGAGVSKPALYYYFEDKADLYVTVVQEAWERLSPVKRLDVAGLETDTFWPSLEQLFEANIARCREEPWLTAVGKLAYHPPREEAPAGAVARMFEEAKTFQQGLLRRGQELGTVRDDLPEELLIAMLTAADTAADHWMVDHWDVLGHEEAERIARTVFRAIRALMSPAPGGEAAP